MNVPGTERGRLAIAIARTRTAESGDEPVVFVEFRESLFHLFL